MARLTKSIADVTAYELAGYELAYRRSWLIKASYVITNGQVVPQLQTQNFIVDRLLLGAPFAVPTTYLRRGHSHARHVVGSDTKEGDTAGPPVVMVQMHTGTNPVWAANTNTIRGVYCTHPLQSTLWQALALPASPWGIFRSA